MVVVAVTVTVSAVQGGQPVEEEEGEEVEEVLWGRCQHVRRFRGVGEAGRRRGLCSTLTWTTWGCLCCGGGLAIGDVVC